MRVLEDTKMAGLCNWSQWYLRAAALLLVAFYLTHDDSTRLHSRGISLPLAVQRAFSRTCVHTRVCPTAAHAMYHALRARRGDRDSRVVRVYLVHVHVSRTYDHHGHERPRRAVKASQSSFHCCSLHGRVGNTRRFERKSNPRKGQRTARTRPAYIYIHTCWYLIHIRLMCAYIYI